MICKVHNIYKIKMKNIIHVIFIYLNLVTLLERVLEYLYRYIQKVLNIRLKNHSNQSLTAELFVGTDQ